MAMYLMKPYYATRGGRTTTTTYRTSEHCVSTIIGDSARASAYFNNITRCPAVTNFSTKSSTAGFFPPSTYTSFSVSATIPLALSYLSNFGTTGDVYSMYSTNRTVIDLKNVHSDYMLTYFSSSSTASNSNTTAAVGLTSLTHNNSDNGNLYYGLTITSGISNSSNLTDNMILYKLRGGTFGSGLQFLATDPYNMYFSHGRQRFSKSRYYYLTLTNAIYFEISDPTKITVIAPPEVPEGGYMSTLFSQLKLTMYRATLSETTI